MKHILFFIAALMILSLLGRIACGDIPNYELIDNIREINLNDCLTKEIS